MRRIAAGAWLALVGTTSFCVGVARAQERSANCADIGAEKQKVYGFEMAKLDDAQLAAKGKEIEEFWKHTQASGPDGVRCIKELLKSEKTDHNFQFDAASFVFQQDKSAETLELVRDALKETDFQQTDPASFLSLALELGQRGVDIQALAARLLLFPNAVVHVSEHALELDSDSAALFLYGSMDPIKASRALTQQLDVQEPFVPPAAAHLLAEQLTEESFRAMSKWPFAADIPEEYRRNDIQAVMKYQAPDPAELANPKWTRAQVLQIIAGLPHTKREFDETMKAKGAAFDQQMKDKKPSQDELAKIVAESEPIYGIADHTAFQNAAVATLRAEDLETLRQARRKALYDVSDESLSEYLAFTQVMIRLINRLDLYKEYRAH